MSAAVFLTEPARTMVRNRQLIWAAFSLILVAANVGVFVDALGVNWGTQASDPLNPSVVVQLLKDNKINKVKLFDSDHWTVRFFAGTGIEVMLGIPNNMLEHFAKDLDNAKTYVKENVSDHLYNGGVDIKYIAVGNEPFLSSYKGANVKTIFPAMKNIHKALKEAGLADKIKVTIPQNADVYSSGTSGPSQGDFRQDIRSLMYDIVHFLRDNNSPFLVNIYPFLSLYENPNFPVDFAFFGGGDTTIQDNGITYDNMFDANLDTLAHSLKKANSESVKVVVGEIGWPTDGHIAANISMAKRFYDGLFKKMATGKGTPMHPGNIEYYLFGLTDENQKSIAPGNFERHWGIFRYDGKPKFPMDFTGSGQNTWPVAAKNVEYMEQKWCLLKNDVRNISSEVYDNVGYACSRSDCTSLFHGSSCNKLDLRGNVSYAFNMYFQIQHQSVEACDFQGLAKIYTQNISTKECLFPLALQSDGIRLKIESRVSILMAFLIFFALL